jgi:tRNA A-37 threonylcarbamoyl transferase component Bud32
MFNMRAFKQAGVYDHIFRKEAKLWTALAECSETITPRLYEVFHCGNYGLIVSDKWAGDLMYLLKRHPEFREEDKLRGIYDTLRQLLTRLHQCGYVHGKMETRSIVYTMSAEGPVFHLINFQHARKTKRDRARQKDFRELKHVFEELRLLISTEEVHDLLPIHVKHDATNL